MQIHLPARVRGRPGRSVVAFWAGALLAVAMLPSPAQAQSFTWNGATSDYGIAGNWSPAAGGPPSLPGQSAVFAGTGSSTITVGIGAAPLPFMFANSWTFTSNSQSYAISGIDLGFNVSGPTGGIINNAGAGKTISIDNRINDGFGGPVGVQQLGNSTLILSGSNSYSGGTLISAGTVQVTNADSVGTGTVTLNGGTFQMQSPTVVSVNFLNNFAVNARGGTVDAAGAEVTLSGTIADGGGAGVLGLTDSVGGGFVQLSGINSYSGGTLVSGTTLFVSNNSSVGTGTVTLDSGTFIGDGASNLTFANNFRINNNTIFNVIDANGRTLTIAGTISDGAAPGMLTVDDASLGNGRVVLLGNNTYSGGTFICFCGTLQLGDATHTASIVGDVTNEGQFIIANANMSTMRSITNDGGLATFLNGTSAASIAITNRNFGETEFVGNATAGNATITNLSGGQTFFLDNSSAGSATITNFSHGGGGIPVGLFFSDNSSAGNATIINNSGGTIDFGFPFGTDTATAGHANITNNAGSQLQFNAFTTAGNAVITTESGGAVAFFDNSTGGNAQFITNGTGYVDFGFSSGPNGDGRITAGSIAGSGFYYIGGGITLAVGGNNLSTVVSGVISDNDPCGCTTGPGSLEKDGSGTLTLSGINAYTGTTVVNGGFLDVEGSIATSSLTTVNAGGALIGAGIVGDTSIANGGIFAPGNGSGTSMTVQGNLAFQSGALYLVQLNSFANVTGTATLAGNVGATLDPSASFVKKQYMILQAAGGVSGTFGAVAAPGGLVGTVSYDPTHAYLNFDLNYGAKNNLNINQQNVANTLSNFFNANGGISAVFAALTPAGLSQASGETGTGIQQATFNAMNMFLNLLTDPFVSGRGGDVTVSGGAQPYAEEDDAMAYAARKSGSARDALAKIPTKAGVARNDLLDNRWSVWGSAFGGGANISGNAAVGSNSADARAFGFAAGADYRISPTTLAGFALAGGGTNFSVANSGSGRSDMFQAGAFVRHSMGAAYVTGALAYSGQQVTTDRIVTIAGLDHLQAQFNANSWSARLEGGYRYATPWMGITPYAAAQFTTIELPSYAEQVVAGAGNFALNYNGKDVTDSRTELGFRTDKSWAEQNGILTLRGRLAWAHDFNTDRSASAVFQSLPGTFFVVNGAAVAHDSALVTASVERKWLSGWSAAATFEGEFSNVSNSYAGKAAVRYDW